MQDARSSNSRMAKGSRWSSFHLGISAFAALAGVVFAAIQAFSPTLGTQPINVTVKVEQSNAVIFGFQLTAVDPGGEFRGVFALPPAVPQPLLAPAE